MSQRTKYLLPRLLFTLGLCAVCMWYLGDAVSQSTSPTNLILLLPATVLAILLGGLVIADEVAKARRLDDSEKRAARRAVNKLDWRIPALMIFVGLYVLVTMTVGFIDVATAVFIAVSLVMLGERRPWMVAAFSLIFSLVVVWGLEATLSYDVPTLLL